MKILNQHNLPAPLIAAVSLDNYNKGHADFSCTELLRPAYMAQLEKKHKDEIEVDATDLIYRLMGQAAHVILERAALANPDYIVERRYYTGVDGHTIGGQLDLYDPSTKTLFDWKTSSVWKEILGDKDDWIAQGNINKFILERNDIPVEKIIYIVFYRDWKKRDSFRDDYPKAPVGQYDFGELWTEEKTLSFIRERINEHLKEASPCSAEERWERPAKWAVKKKGGVRATKVFDFEIEAKSFCQKKDGYEVEHRPAEYVRCAEYCSVSSHCAFYQELIKTRNPNE